MVRLFIGVCSSAEKGGLFTAEFDALSGRLSAPQRVPGSGPSVFLCASGDRLYSVVNLGSSAFLETFALPGRVPALLSRLNADGAGMAYVSAVPGQLLCAYYTQGIVRAYPVGPDGLPGRSLWECPGAGSGPNRARQEGPHPHSVVPSPDGCWAVAADLGADSLSVFPLRPGGLPPMRWFGAAPGSGPRYAAFSQDGRALYLVSELSCSLSRYFFDAANGALRLAEELPLLRSGESGAGGDLQLSADGQFLYAGVRGPDRIAAFRLLPGGSLRPVGQYEAGGSWCSSFRLSPDGRFLLAANFRSGSVCVLPRRQDGSLGAPVQTVLLGDPMCLRFSE